MTSGAKIRDTNKYNTILKHYGNDKEQNRMAKTNPPKQNDDRKVEQSQ